MEFYPPTTPGEWVQAFGAGITALVGLFLLLAPGFILKLTEQRVGVSYSQTASTTRAHLSGILLGFGASALMLQQPLIYLALGISWGFSAFSQLLSLLLDRNASTAKIIILILKALLSSGLILAVFGFFG